MRHFVVSSVDMTGMNDLVQFVTMRCRYFEVSDNGTANVKLSKMSVHGNKLANVNKDGSQKNGCC